MHETTKQNHLANELSPYLKQHAMNPVDWYPWCDAAIAKARKEDKPILLSIGYAACHWCHVMAHESFEDIETADLMNKHFINIKVDREERPDLDKIYQTTHYLLTHRDGGWPLTVFLMPDLTPFYSGTFFPLKSRYQLPSFKEVISVIIDMFNNHRADLDLQNEELKKILHHKNKINLNVELTDKPIIKAMETLQWNYDNEYGGFTGAPKFFQPTKLSFLMIENSPLIEHGLKEIALGGINDHISGGFFRYAVDDKWHIPHFEKMLYDNAQLIALYAEAGKQYNNDFFISIAKATAEWAFNTMRSPEGAYYASIDADSEDEEGKYYLWKRSEIKQLLSNEEYAFAKLHFGLDKEPNFEQRWHLYISQPIADVAKQLNITIQNANDLLSSIKQKLAEQRKSRKHPFIDNEILTSWNALMVKGLLTLASVTGEKKYLDAATITINFIKNKLWQNKRLCACYKNGKAYIKGYLDDYAFLLDALVTAIPLLPNNDYLPFANEIADTIMKYFYDHENSGFYFTAADQEVLLYRPKTFVDEAVPSGNGIVTQALLKLDALHGDDTHRQTVERTFKLIWPNLQQYAAEHCSSLIALQMYLDRL